SGRRGGRPGAAPLRRRRAPCGTRPNGATTGPALRHVTGRLRARRPADGARGGSDRRDWVASSAGAGSGPVPGRRRYPVRVTRERRVASKAVAAVSSSAAEARPEPPLIPLIAEPRGSAQSLWWKRALRSEEHTSELQSRGHLVCRLLLEKKKKQNE